MSTAETAVCRARRALKQTRALGAALPEPAAVILMNMIVRGHIVLKIFPAVGDTTSVKGDTVRVLWGDIVRLHPAVDITIEIILSNNKGRK